MRLSLVPGSSSCLQQSFSRKYKLAAVKKIIEQGLSDSEVARELSVSEGMLRNWRKYAAGEDRTGL